MNEETRQQLEEFQEELRAKSEEELSFSDDRVYGMALMLETILSDDLTLPEAMEEFLENSKLETEVTYNG